MVSGCICIYVYIIIIIIIINSSIGNLFENVIKYHHKLSYRKEHMH